MAPGHGGMFRVKKRLTWLPNCPAPLFHQEHRTRSLDLTGNFSVKMRRHARHPARKDFAAFSNKFLQQVRVFIIDCLRRDIDPATRHNAICAAEIGPAFGIFRFHVITSLPGAGCDDAERDCTFSFPNGQVYLGSFYCAC